MGLKILKNVDRELTEKEISEIKQFRSYTDGIGLAYLGDCVAVMSEDFSGKDLEKFKKDAIDLMRETLCTHPDFSLIPMDDGNVIILLDSGVFAFGEKIKSDAFTGVVLREKCLGACEKEEIVAIVYEED